MNWYKLKTKIDPLIVNNFSYEKGGLKFSFSIYHNNSDNQFYMDIKLDNIDDFLVKGRKIVPNIPMNIASKYVFSDVKSEFYFVFGDLDGNFFKDDITPENIDKVALFYGVV